MTTIRNKRWQMRNGNQVLRDIRQTQVAIVYPNHMMVFRGACHRYGTWEAARDAAEKMAAAGFGERKRGEFAERRQRWLATRFGALRLWGFAPTLSGYEPVKLESRQRPRKGVRLGKRGRRLAVGASVSEAPDATKHLRQMPERGGWHDAMLGPLADIPTVCVS